MQKFLGATLLALASFLLLPLAAAAPVVNPQGIASLYAKLADGTRTFFCSGSLIQDSRLFAQPILLSAGHCLTAVLDGNTLKDLAAPIYATFDDGDSFVAVTPVILGDPGKGYDYSLWVVNDLSKVASKKPYTLSKEKVAAGDYLETWGFPAGAGLTLTIGYVRIPDILRAWRGSEIDWEGYIGADINTAGGASGSAVFNAKGEVAGVLCGTYSDGRGFQITAILPINRIFEDLEARKKK